MALPINRRNWLKASTLLTGGLAFAPAIWNRLQASPVKQKNNINSDAEFLADIPPVLKARLSANENPFGPSDKAKLAITAALGSSYQYGFMGNRTLAQKIAAKENFDSKMVMLGAGSTPILHATAIHYSKDGGNIVTGDPSYADLPAHAELLHSKWVKVPLTADYKLDLDAMEKAVTADTKLVCICNPNNPTGTSLETSKLKAFCERVSKKVPVFVDEAYIDYLPDPQGSSMLPLVKAGNNIIVARTFSKLYGFAGLRIGYAIAPTSILDMLELYNSDAALSSLSVGAAIAAYDDQEYLRSAHEKTMVSKEFLYSVLKAEGYEYIPTSANFVMFPIKMDGKRFSEEMFKRGVSIRNWKFNNKDWCRVSIGRMDEMQAFADAFKQIS